MLPSREFPTLAGRAQPLRYFERSATPPSSAKVHEQGLATLSLYPLFSVDEIQLDGPPFAEPVAASKKFLRRVHDAETARLDSGIETTLASGTYIPRVRHWTSLGSLISEWYHWRSDEHGIHFVSAQRN